MIIREMSRVECLQMLSRNRLARLACARENQPYIVPVSLVSHESANDGPCLYGITTPGQKIEWMRANPLVCIEFDEVASQSQWVSVIVFGRFEELPETLGSDDSRHRAQQQLLHIHERPFQTTEGMLQVPSDDDERLRAYNLLKTEVFWWEPGWAAWVARPHHKATETYKIIYFKIHIDSITGHESTLDVKDAASYSTQATRTGRWAKFRNQLSRLFGGTRP